MNTWYGDRKILSDVSLNVVRKEIMVIMGYSGSGKSIPLRHMIDLDKPVSGSIKLLNEEITNLDRIAYDATTYGIDNLDRATIEGEDHGVCC